MLAQVKDFVDVGARARELGCRVPVRIALLPGNFSAATDAGAFCYHAATPYVRSAWWSVGLEDEGPEVRGIASSAAHGRNSSGIVGRVPSGIHCPVSVLDLLPAANTESAKVPLAVFFGLSLLDGPAWCLAVALGLASSVLASHPRCVDPRQVGFDAAVQRPGGGCACLEYRGDAYGLVALARDVRGIWAGK